MSPKPTTPSPYTKAFIKAQVERIKAERRLILEEIATDAEQIKELERSGDESAAIDEVAVTLAEKEIGHTLVEAAMVTLEHIDLALKNVDEETYGWDPKNQVWIREERLGALPWATEEIMNAQVDETGDVTPPSI